ncbi:MAG: FG-GAP-like repeat-containing protein, partial [Vicinamibacterales bacterium]
MRHYTQSVVRAVLILILISSSAGAGTVRPTGASVPGEVLVRIQAGASGAAISNIEQLADADDGQRIANLKSGAAIWRLRSRSKNVEALVTALAKNPHVEYAEPNYVVRLATTPNDPAFGQLWGLKNTGQVISGSVGFGGSDIDAEPAWSITTGSASIVVGVVDTGVDYTHPDLAANMWSNPGGKGNVACGAGTHGFNAITKTCDPMDDHDHGTHCAGTIGAVGNNNVGVTGVNWTTSIMALKFIAADGYGTTADAIAAIDFAVQAKIDGVNVRVLSNSWGNISFSKALLDVINKANENDILFVAAAGNDGSNNDFTARYPSNFATANMIAVAATENRDGLAYFSNYGATTVHLGAPGVSVLSTTPGNTYSFFSGTSMATPHVAGVAALILAKTPGLTTAEVKQTILESTDPIPSLAGRTITGGRLNAARAVGATVPPEFTLALSPASRSIVRGSSTTYTVTVTPSNGFAGSVALSVSNLPSGATGSFSPASTSTTSTLTVTTSNSTPINPYTLTVTGVSGSLTRTTFGLLQILATQPPAACPQFSTGTLYSASTPTAVATGDFNRDGRADVAVTYVNSNVVAVRMGNGSGALLSSVPYGVGTAPIAVAAGDVNGDGRADLAVANSGSNDVSVLLASGDGTFASSVAYDAGTSPFAVAIADFNNDGKSDLVVANNSGSDVSILTGIGDGTFNAAVDYDVASGPFGVTVGDFDRDGDADLAVADYNVGKVSVLLGNGDATFAAAVHYSTANGASAVTTADFNGDGKPDLAVSNYGANSISVLLGNGNGTFAAAIHYPIGAGPYSVTAGDFNGDGNSDLIAANGDSNNVSILMGNGTGAFQPVLYHPTGGYEPNHLSVADFNADGKTDFVVANTGYNAISLILNQGVCSASCNAIAGPVH